MIKATCKREGSPLADIRLPELASSLGVAVKTARDHVNELRKMNWMHPASDGGWYLRSFERIHTLLRSQDSVKKRISIALEHLDSKKMLETLLTHALLIQNLAAQRYAEKKKRGRSYLGASSNSFQLSAQTLGSWFDKGKMWGSRMRKSLVRFGLVSMSWVWSRTSLSVEDAAAIRGMDKEFTCRLVRKPHPRLNGKFLWLQECNVMRVEQRVIRWMR